MVYDGDHTGLSHVTWIEWEAVLVLPAGTSVNTHAFLESTSFSKDCKQDSDKTGFEKISDSIGSSTSYIRTTP